LLFRATLGGMLPLRLVALSLLLVACGGLVGDGEDEPAPEPAPAPAETAEPEPEPEPEPECQPGERRCSGAVREFCDRDGVSWTKIEVCEAPFACDPTHCRPE
jgi:hypothetical protein